MVAGQVGIRGANVPDRAEVDTSTATDTVTIPLQNMEGNLVLEQARKHARVLSKNAQVLIIYLIANILTFSFCRS